MPQVAAHLNHPLARYHPVRAASRKGSRLDADGSARIQEKPPRWPRRGDAGPRPLAEGGGEIPNLGGSPGLPARQSSGFPGEPTGSTTARSAPRHSPSKRQPGQTGLCLSRRDSLLPVARSPRRLHAPPLSPLEGTAVEEPPFWSFDTSEGRCAHGSRSSRGWLERPFYCPLGPTAPEAPRAGARPTDPLSPNSLPNPDAEGEATTRSRRRS